MEADKNALGRILIESERLEDLRQDDRKLIAKLASQIDRDQFFFVVSLIWFAFCVVASLYLLLS
jgi:hypothetical protein